VVVGVVEVGVVVGVVVVVEAVAVVVVVAVVELRPVQPGNPWVAIPLMCSIASLQSFADPYLHWETFEVGLGVGRGRVGGRERTQQGPYLCAH
jgi:hypothetical protein